MPRLRNIQSGAVVSCSEATAARLGPEWAVIVPPTPTAPAKRTPRKRPVKKTDTEE